MNLTTKQLEKITEHETGKKVMYLGILLNDYNYRINPKTFVFNSVDIPGKLFQIKEEQFLKAIKRKLDREKNLKQQIIKF